ncbi:MAG TPA: hypothetical protein PLS10_08520 [Chitinophagales bacterium]|nr:hypothetical protein [Chitinophagales bacterium]
MTAPLKPLIIENRNNCLLQPYFGQVNLYYDSWADAVGTRYHVAQMPEIQAEFVGILQFYFYEWEKMLDAVLISDFHSPTTMRELCGYGNDAIDIINAFHAQHLANVKYNRGNTLAALYIYKNVSNEPVR